MNVQRKLSNTGIVFDPRGKVGERIGSDRPARRGSWRACGSASSIIPSGTPTSCCVAAPPPSPTTVKFGTVNYYVKHNFSKDAAPDLLEQIALENDIVLTAIGDCGSCCSCCIRDAVALERAGNRRPRPSSPPNSHVKPS